ncbi:MAG: 1-acyl-sn-glycerol-3-phosphate acyltransferase [Clostridia bacterium]|nr:1-acyl-sn-glycerol-3-phosphate acyltransferase [Clostridia bacterium]
MKIKTKFLTYDKVKELKKPKHHPPKKPWFLFSLLVYVLSIPDLIKTKFKCNYINKFKFKKEPYLILMNHSSFIDLKIASHVLFPKPYSIVCTTDGLVGKKWLMEKIGCVPTQKFVRDITLIKDLTHILHKNKVSVLMFPEAGYSFDGTSTALPQNFSRLIKLLNVSVAMIKTDGAFLFDPLYNSLQQRKVKVSASVYELINKDDVKTLSLQEIELKVKEAFSFNAFKTQLENKVVVNEPFRADGLERILYKCANCKSEGTTIGKGVTFTCSNCKKSYEFTKYGELKALQGETEFSHIPSYYNWERETVKSEILSGNYKIEAKVKIGVIKNYSALYMIGNGTLTHDENGFTLTSDDGLLNYKQPPLSSYSLNSDYYWYEIGDMICIGDKDYLYYCFPEDKSVSVTKARLATEELYKIKQKELSI